MEKAELVRVLLECGFIDQYEADVLLQPDYIIGSINAPKYIQSSTGIRVEITYSLN